MTEPAETNPDPRSVFVVHGRNEAVRRSMFDFLRAINLQPIEWSTALAFTGTASPYIGDVLEAAFVRAAAVVVLFTPDEIAYLREDLSYHGEADARPQLQARPNVLFEAGMAFGTHPDKTVLVEVGLLRSFSDVAGRHILRLTNDVAARQQLATRLREAGCGVQTDGTDWHNAGDFSPPPPPTADVTPAEATKEAPKVREAREDLRFGFEFPTYGRARVKIFNRGDHMFKDLHVEIPEVGGLEFETGTDKKNGMTLYAKSIDIPLLPGKQSVTVLLRRQSRRTLEESSFFVEVRATRDDGEVVKGAVFVDLNDDQ
ncbi:TIR domain-containing protein [Nocardioides sp. NPDC126508]